VLFKDQVLEVRKVEGRLRIARKERRHNEWTPRSRPMTLTARARKISRTEGRYDATGASPCGDWTRYDATGAWVTACGTLIL
jgi:hypothetical protein